MDNLKTKDCIYLDEAMRAKMLDIYRNGYDVGETTYFKTIDKHFKWLKGDLTLMGGIANHGKSKLIKQLMLIKSVREDVRWAIFSPEENPPYFFYSDLAHTYLGKPVSTRYYTHATEDEYGRAMNFIREHFFFIYPEDESPSPSYINERFLESMEKDGSTGFLTDPFNQLDNDWRKDGGRDDQYISKYLTAEKRFAMKQNVYKIIIAHPSNSLKRKADGNLPEPNIENLAGGALWSQKCDNVLCTHRPFYTSDYTIPTTQFHSQKIKKQMLVGIPGMVELSFDVASNRYLEDGKSPFTYAVGEAAEIKTDQDFFNRGAAQTTPWD